VLSVITFLISLAFWGFVLLTSAFLFPIAFVIRIVTTPFDRRLIILHRFSCFWASLYTWCNSAWHVRIDGKEKIDRRTAYIMVANHQSLVDILVLFRLFVHFKWVSKAENFRIPFIGWNMTLNRYIRIERGSMRGNIGMMRASLDALQEGSSVMIFPEGTRSADGEVHPFKPGAFELALKSRRPILPIVIDGTAAALPKQGFVLRGRHNIVAKILDPVAPERFKGSGAAGFASAIQSMIEAELKVMRQR
jgi:1-acyl-sn-glycerol-3-phosphate acyltransferase